MMTLIPWYYRWAAIGLLAASVAITAALKMHEHDQREFDAYVAQVRAAGEAQTKKTAGIVTAQTNITTDIGASYGSASARLRPRSGSGALHSTDSASRPGSGSVPAVPRAAPGADGSPADARPHPTDPPADLATCQAEYVRLREDAAQTTLQALYWQAWARREREANPGK